MADSLADFLGVRKKPSSILRVTGSLSCTECDEVVNEGELNEDTRVLSFICKNNHRSEVSI